MDDMKAKIAQSKEGRAAYLNLLQDEKRLNIPSLEVRLKNERKQLLAMKLKAEAKKEKKKPTFDIKG